MGGQVLHVVGARPNFMKAAPVLRALQAHGIEQRLVHTGQHYDERMSEVFFRELGLPRPDVDLGVGSASHAQQTGALLQGLEPVIAEAAPSAVVVYGDVNSTLAAALVCAKLGIRLVHVEAGLRSFDRGMPEEVNRVLTDAVADLLLITSPEAYAHLADEGVDVDRVRFVGNPMIDTLLAHRDALSRDRLTDLALPERFATATVHRPANVDDPDAAARMVSALHAAADRLPVIVPLHPRGRRALAEAGLEDHGAVQVIEPLGYVDFLSLVNASRAVITDSGGVQEETTILGVDCLTVRPNTERPITITHGTNRLVTPEGLPAALDEALADPRPREGRDTPPLWDGRAGARCAAAIVELTTAS